MNCSRFESEFRFFGLALFAALILLLSAAVEAQAVGGLPDDLPKISPNLLAVTNQLERVSVFIEFKDQPHASVSRRVGTQWAQRLKSAQARLHALSSARPAFDPEVAGAQRDWEAVWTQMRGQEIQELDAVIKPMQDRLETRLIGLGATGIQRYSIINMLKAEVLPSRILEIAREPAVARISPVGIFEGDSQPKPSVAYLGAPDLWNAQPPVTGRSGPSLVILDSGIADLHPAFANKRANIVREHFLQNAQKDLCWGLFDLDADVDWAGHGTSVADIASGGADPSGVAPDLASVGPVKIYILKVLWRRDPRNGPKCRPQEKVATQKCPRREPPAKFSTKIVESDVWLALQYLVNLPAASDLIVNFSAGWPTEADYDDIARRFDRFIDLTGDLEVQGQVIKRPRVTVVVAAGNEGCDGPPLRHTPALAYNVITVGAQDAQGHTPTDEVAAYSGEGPTPGGRKKPDLAAPGTRIRSANALEALPNQPLYRDFGGTSAAAPHVAGAAALIAGAVKTANNMALKALLLNEARRPGGNPFDGWVADRGWGLASLKNFPFRLNEETDTGKAPCEERGLASGAPYRTFCFLDNVSDKAGDRLRFYEGTAKNLTATLVWNLHFPDRAELAQPLPLNNLDLAVYRKKDGEFTDPMKSVSTKDNVEQVEYVVDAFTDVLVKVKLNGRLNKPTRENDFAESYALAVSRGLVPKKPPALKVSCAAPPAARPFQPVSTVCTATNEGELPVSKTSATAVPATVTSGTLGTIAPGGISTPFTVNVTASGTPGGQVAVAVNVSGTLAEEPYSGNTGFSVTTAGEDETPGCTSMESTQIVVPRAGASGTVSLATAPAGCRWTLVILPVLERDDWISVSRTAGTGSVVFTYTVPPNVNTTATMLFGSILSPEANGAVSFRFLP